MHKNGDGQCEGHEKKKQLDILVPFNKLQLNKLPVANEAIRM